MPQYNAPNFTWPIFAGTKQLFNPSMGIALNLIACAFITVWIVEYLGYNAGNNVHILLIIGILLVLVRLSLLIPSRKRA